MNCATELLVTDAPIGETEVIVEQAIQQFLDGDTDGAALFQALYDEILDEPIPAAMLALVRGHNSAK